MKKDLADPNTGDHGGASVYSWERLRSYRDGNRRPLKDIDLSGFNLNWLSYLYHIFHAGLGGVLDVLERFRLGMSPARQIRERWNPDAPAAIRLLLELHAEEIGLHTDGPPFL